MSDRETVRSVLHRKREGYSDNFLVARLTGRRCAEQPFSSSDRNQYTFLLSLIQTGLRCFLFLQTTLNGEHYFVVMKQS